MASEQKLSPEDEKIQQLTKDIKRLELAQKLVQIASARGVPLDHLMALMDDPEALMTVLNPQTDQPAYASSHFQKMQLQGEESVEERQKKEEEWARKQRENRLNEIKQMRDAGIL